jgi:drug/metabolite transporter (DMT)-like permease
MVSRSLKAHLLLVLITLIWGLTFAVIKDALGEISPLLFNAVRVSLAAGILAASFHRDFKTFTWASLRYGVLVGLFLGLGQELQIAGLRLTTASKSAFLTGLAVVLVPVFLALFWGRKVNRWSALGVGAAFVGLYLLTVPASAQGRLDLSSMNHGDLLTLACAVVFAFHIILVEHATRAHSWKQIAVVQTATAALLMTLVFPVAEKSYVIWSPRVIGAIVITGLLSIALAFAVQAWAQQFTPATHTALIFSLEPVFAGITSYLVLGERLGSRAGLGAALILAGVLVSELRGSAESMAVAPDHAGMPYHPQAGEPARSHTEET